MRTTEHKTHVVDDFVEEIRLLSNSLGWGDSHVVRTDLFNVRKDTLIHLALILSEARRRLDTLEAENV